MKSSLIYIGIRISFKIQNENFHYFKLIYVLLVINPSIFKNMTYISNKVDFLVINEHFASN